MSYIRTQKHRVNQAALISSTKPWLKSTGPKSPEGKVRSSQNAFKGGIRKQFRALAEMLRKQGGTVEIMLSNKQMRSTQS